MIAVQGADPRPPGESGAVHGTEPGARADSPELYLRLTVFLIAKINVICGRLAIISAGLLFYVLSIFFFLSGLGL